MNRTDALPTVFVVAATFFVAAATFFAVAATFVVVPGKTTAVREQLIGQNERLWRTDAT